MPSYSETIYPLRTNWLFIVVQYSSIHPNSSHAMFQFFQSLPKIVQCIYKMTQTSRVKNQKPPGKCSLHDVPYHFLNMPKNSARFGKIFHFKTPHLKHCLCYFLTRISLLKQYLLKFSPNLALIAYSI